MLGQRKSFFLQPLLNIASVAATGISQHQAAPREVRQIVFVVVAIHMQAEIQLPFVVHMQIVRSAFPWSWTAPATTSPPKLQ